jgi:chaperonin GroEL
MSNPKQIHFGVEARSKLLDGALKLSKTVGVTYGPHGRTALIQRMAGMLVTKDGVTVAREINLSDPVENMGAEIMKQCCLTVNEQAGDGTTTTSIIAASILQQGHKLVVSGYDPMQIAKGLREAGSVVREFFEAIATPVEDEAALKRVAMISSNGDEEVAENLSKACIAVGNEGTVSIEDGTSVGIELLFKDGLEIDKGWASPYFGHEKQERPMEGPLVAVVNKTLSTAQDVISIMEEASQWPDNHLLLICGNIAGEALQTMVMNDQKGVVKCCAVIAPGFGHHKPEWLKDIAALSGATIIDENTGLDHKSFDPAWFGSFRKATVKTKSSIFEAYEEATETVQSRIAELKGQEAATTSDYDRDRIQERLAKLTGGFCVMRVGGFSEEAMKERRARIEDALSSVQSSLRTGIVPGGGVSYLCAAEVLQDVGFQEGDFGKGQEILAKALQAPIRKIAENAYHEPTHILYEVLRRRESEEEGSWLGWDALTNTFRDFGEDPFIIDPTQVAISCVDAAVSVAASLLTAESSISSIES